MGVVRHGHFIGGKMSPEYAAWSGMWSRCTNKNKRDYPRYGGRGIAVSERWRDFASFLEDMGPRPAVGYSLDRYPNGNGNYEPGNCRWATLSEQNSNRRNNRIVKFRGSEMTLAAAARLAGVHYATARQRIVAGATIERALRPCR